MDRALMVLGLALSLAVPAGMIAQKERLAASGRDVLLDLAPRDPRSLMQGDYMTLRYAIARDVWDQDAELPVDGELVITLDERGVGELVRVNGGEPLAEGELLLRYRRRGSMVRLGAEEFFFQEGNADHYSDARYGELRVTESGDAMLVGLRDEDLNILGPEGDHPLQR